MFACHICATLLKPPSESFSSPTIKKAFETLLNAKTIKKIPSLGNITPSFNLNISLKKFQENNYLLIIISNQGGISKGIYTIEQVEEVHNYLKNYLQKHNIELTEIYYCPHHSSNEKCLCRKPNTLLLEKAIARFNIDVSSSFLIGDGDRDIEAGNKIGLHTIKIETNENILKYCKLIVNS